MTVKEQYSHFLISNYAAPPLVLVRGEGCRVFDEDGRSYLDFTSGIAVNALGHCHPKWVEAVRRQAGIMTHCSNLYAHPGQAELARKLAARVAAPGKVLFCNSGAEANEALLKLARLHGRRLSGAEGQRFEVIVAENAFHGRTFGGMAATPQEKIQGGFRPMLPGFHTAPLNDLAAFERLIGAQTAAVFLETIQGEGGVFPAEPEFLRDLQVLCRERDVLFMLDEVQCGIGRSGRFFAFEEAGIIPDAIGMAKGLGGGFPLGAIWVAEPHADLFQPGSHGTTFGGNPLAAAAALAVLEVLESEGLVERVRQLSDGWHASLRRLALEFPARIAGVRGRGYMVGLALHEEPAGIVAALRSKGMLAVPAGQRTLRLLPPLIAGEAELQESLDLLRQALAE